MTADFIKQHLALTNSGKSLSWLSALNERGQAAFANAKVPTRKTENWKYTSLNLLAGDDNVAKFANAAPLTSANFDAASLPVINDLNAMRLVVVNGQVDVDASDQSALDLVVRFSDASTEQQAQITEQLGSIIGERGHLFNQLNDASINDGIFISVDRNQRLEVPLYICYVHTKEHEAFSTHTRLLVLLDVNAEATIVEEYRDQGNGLSFVNHVSEIRVGDNAKLTHYRLQMMQENILHVGSTHIDLQRDAQYQGFHLGLGTALTRNDVVINHNVGGSHCELNGVYVPKNKQVIDFHTSIDHKAAYCTSDEVFRGIMNDHSKAIFNGRIHIHPDAQKTLAQL
ncbi:MAG: SufD family Fe-S cluster assembly protein, partial [Oleibacter sp.]|nr:SufD family Fe-S cluster assembly protein [Thalassolituus sp.]